MSKDIDYKIQKYTKKLRKSINKDTADYYQEKLKYYHQLNQYDGYQENIISEIVKKTKK
jgi:hypothetical protein